jgi:hypothetical protein
MIRHFPISVDAGGSGPHPRPPRCRVPTRSMAAPLGSRQVCASRNASAATPSFSRSNKGPPAETAGDGRRSLALARDRWRWPGVASARQRLPAPPLQAEPLPAAASSPRLSGGRPGNGRVWQGCAQVRAIALVQATEGLPVAPEPAVAAQAPRRRTWLVLAREFQRPPEKARLRWRRLTPARSLSGSSAEN